MAYRLSGLYPVLRLFKQPARRSSHNQYDIVVLLATDQGVPLDCVYVDNSTSGAQMLWLQLLTVLGLTKGTTGLPQGLDGI